MICTWKRTPDVKNQYRPLRRLAANQNTNEGPISHVMTRVAGEKEIHNFTKKDIASIVSYHHFFKFEKNGRKKMR